MVIVSSLILVILNPLINELSASAYAWEYNHSFKDCYR